MTLNYGYTHECRPCKRIYLFNFHYPGLAKNQTLDPFIKISHYDYPITSVYHQDLNEKTKITLLYHVFNNDSPLSTLTIEYKLFVYPKNDTTTTHSLKTFQFTDIKKFRKYYLAVLDTSFLLKDYVSKPQDVLFFYIQILKTSDGPSGNESVLNFTVETLA